jgi:hypothetical protein
MTETRGAVSMTSPADGPRSVDLQDARDLLPEQVVGLPAAGPPTESASLKAAARPWHRRLPRGTRRYFPKVTEILPLKNGTDTSPPSDHSLTGSK